MKIIQSFWSNSAYTSQIYNSAGWLAAEYHWMSWALSTFTLWEQYEGMKFSLIRPESRL